MSPTLKMSMNSPPVNSKPDSVSTTTTSSSSVQRRKSSLSLGARFNGGVGKTFKVIVLGQASVGKTGEFFLKFF